MEPVEITLVVLGVSVAVSILILTVQLARLAEKVINLMDFVEDTTEAISEFTTELKDDYHNLKDKMNLSSMGAVALAGAIKTGRNLKNLFVKDEKDE